MYWINNVDRTGVCRIVYVLVAFVEHGTDGLVTAYI